MSLKRLFAEFTEVRKLDDGTRIVEGIASSEARDSDGELIRAEAMRKALPAYMKFANVREMHQAIAAGTAKACFVDDAGVTRIAAHIVDANTVKKVDTKTLKGFSIGGKVLKRDDKDSTIIDEISLVEISVVDRPANPDAMIELCKIDKGDPEKPAPVAKAQLSDEMKKGLYAVAYLAEAINTLNNLAADAQWEADYEGDGSAIPGRLKTVVSELCSILRDMAAEETAELTGDVIAMAAKPGALKKTEKLAALAKSIAAAAKGEHAKALTDLEKRAADAESSAKASSEKCAAAETAKAAAEKLAADANDAQSKAGEAIEKMLAERDAVTKSMATLKAELERKGVLRVVPVSKADDAKTDSNESGEAAKDAVGAIKKIHAGGGRSRL